MLCQFTFSNYRSYRDEVTLSMQASSIKELSHSLLACGDNQSFLPVAAIYGPNAGGKSNLLDALGYVQSAVSRPIYALMSDREAPEGSMARLSRCSPFAFDAVHADMPSDFEVYYRVEEYEYRYALSVSASKIVSEGLWRRKLGASRAAMLFEREEERVGELQFDDPVSVIPLYEQRPRDRASGGKLVPRLRLSQLQQLLSRASSRGNA